MWIRDQSPSKLGGFLFHALAYTFSHKIDVWTGCGNDAVPVGLNLRISAKDEKG